MHNVVDKLISNIENEIVEFKKAENQFDTTKLGKYFSALSNEANLKNEKFGWILFGVTDDRKIFGTNINDVRINSYKEEIAKHTTANISFIDFHRVLYQEKSILLLQIPAAPKGMPIAYKGHYYGRDGEALVPLNIEEIERIRNQVTATDWSAEILSSPTLDDLSKTAIQAAKVQFIVKNPKLKDDIKNWDDITFLNKAKITIKGKITNTAILLLGKPESEHFLAPSIAKISWILKDRDNIEKDYEHFTCPFFLNIQEVYQKIRNLKYRYLQSGNLFPEEVDQYAPYIIREALNNCIAHQDYAKVGRIIIVEKENGILIFKNSGNFIPQSIENVLLNDAPESRYRNPFLANAMVNLNMIDTIGSGIKKMFIIQKDKYFPLPEYDFTNNSVTVTISGKVLDPAYAVKLAQVPELSLEEIIMLDKIQKQKDLKDIEISILKTKKLIEGRKPNFHISSLVAQKIDEKSKYIRMKGIDTEFIKEMILQYLKKFKEGKRVDFEKMLLDKLPETLDINQKKNRIKNILQIMKKEELIANNGKIWKMSKTK